MAIIVQLEPAPILTVKNWDTKKGSIAKIAGETGMTKQLKELAAVYKRTPWNLLHPDEAWRLNPAKRSMQQQATAAEMRDLKKVALSNGAKLEPLRNQLKAVRDLALALEKKWKASKLIPSSSTKLVADMARSADLEFIALKSLDTVWDDRIKDAHVKDERIKAVALQAIKPYFASMSEFAKQIKQTPTVAAYDSGAKTGFHQNIRGLNAALERSRSPQLMEWKERSWKHFAQDSYKPTQDNQVLPKLNEVMSALKELHTLVS